MTYQVLKHLLKDFPFYSKIVATGMEHIPTMNNLQQDKIKAWKS